MKDESTHPLKWGGKWGLAQGKACLWVAGPNHLMPLRGKSMLTGGKTEGQRVTQKSGSKFLPIYPGGLEATRGDGKSGSTAGVKLNSVEGTK